MFKIFCKRSKFDIQMSQEKSDISHMVILCIDAVGGPW